jgi:hypothetical protein
VSSESEGITLIDKGYEYKLVQEGKEIVLYQKGKAFYVERARFDGELKEAC